jgi:hypothetical protein
VFKNLKMMKHRTTQRDAIQQVIRIKDRALAAAEILYAGRQMVPSLNQSTMFRNLKLLIEKGWLRKINHPVRGPHNLLQLLVILYIAVGMPVAHPLIHEHSEHDRSGPAYGGLHFHSLAGEGETHHCPICDFEATNQLHATVCNLVPDWNQPLDDFVFINVSFSLKAAPQSVDARSPPSLSAISQSVAFLAFLG